MQRFTIWYKTWLKKGLTEESVSFKWTFRSYEYHNYESNYKDSVGHYHIMWFGYPNLDVKINTRAYLVDFNTLVSAVGGGLGLFLGISVIDSLFHLYSLIFKIAD